MTHKGPLVRNRPRKRNRDGTWRKKRSDAGKKREKIMDNGEPLTEKQMTDVTRLSITTQLRWLIEHRSDELAPAIEKTMQTYILLQILDTLDNINEKLAMMNINIQDVEQAVLTKEQERG